jgi:broad specificity phosphatase PhoE
VEIEGWIDAMAFCSLSFPTFYFMRHAQSVDGEKGLVPQSDACDGLTPLGVRQVLDVADEVQRRGLVPATLLTSPLERARATAQILADRWGLPCREIASFREHGLGDWEGQAWHLLSERFERREAPPNGEPFPVFYRRLVDGLDQVARAAAPVLVVAHGGVWHGFKALCDDFTTDWIPYACFCKVTLQDGHMTSNRLIAPSPLETRATPVLAGGL